MYPREESNFHLILRRDLFYPLNYRGGSSIIPEQLQEKSLFRTIAIYKGPIAHLVERYYGIVEVTGSIPVRSTKKVYCTLCKNLYNSRKVTQLQNL